MRELIRKLGLDREAQVMLAMDFENRAGQIAGLESLRGLRPCSLALYILSYRAVRLLYFRRLGWFRRLYLPPSVLFLYRIFLRRLPARGQVTQRDEGGRQDENGNESSSHVSPSL